MKVIDLKERTIYVDDIQQIYKEIKYNPNRYVIYKIQTINGTYAVDEGDYFKVKDYLLSLNEKEKTLEEEKKIPEKIPYYSMEKIQKAKNKDEWQEERIILLEKRVNDLHIKMNDLLDYLKSKGE